MYAWLVGCKFKGCEEQCRCDDGTTDDYEPMIGDTLEHVGIAIHHHTGYCYYDIVYTKNEDGGEVEVEGYDFAVIDLLKRLPELDI
jgi:hypothetical protein